MKTIRFWEELSANIFPAFDHILYDGWLLRFADGRTCMSGWGLPVVIGSWRGVFE